jgi:uncharacterized protein (UPF0332 family)
VTTSAEGSSTIQFLLDRNRLERIDEKSVERSAATVINRAKLRLLTAEGGFALGDTDGSYAAAYDAYRMCAEALLLSQGLRATGGEGSHVTVEDAVSAQFSVVIPGFAKPTFERLRRTRHSAQYFDPSSAEISPEDSQWALATARSVVSAVGELLKTDPPTLFRETE